MVFSLFGVSWVMLKGVENLLVSWQDKFGRCQSVEIWRIIPLASCRKFGGREMQGSLKGKNLLFLI